MSLLRNNNVLFYHPLDSDTEYTQSFDWTRTANGIFETGVVVSGFTQVGDTTVDIRANKVAGGYDDLENYNHFTIAFWSSGLYGGTIKDDTIEIGFGSTSVDDGNGVRYSMSEVSNAPFVRLIKTGLTGPAKEVPIFPSMEGWHLTIVDFSLQGSTWQYLVSINGSGWQNIGSGHNSNLPDTDTNCIIDLALELTSVNIILDEIVVWAGQDIFTNDELSNLYELINTYDQSMDQYSTFFPTPANSGTDCFIHGYLQTSGDIGLYIPSQKETKSTNLFTEGSIQVSGNINLYISGSPPVASSSIDLYMPVPTPSSGNISLYIAGPLSESGNIDNFIHGHNTSSGNIDKYIQGFLPSSGNADLYMFGVPVASSSITLYTVGPILSSGNADDFIWGHLLSSGNFPLFIHGRSLDTNVFVSVSDNNPSDNMDLFVYGVPSGEANTFYTNDTTTLFIKDDGDDNFTDSSWSVFTRVADPIATSGSGIWQSFLRGGNAKNDEVNLYTYGHAPGEPPHGTLVSGSVSIFINGQSTQSGDEGLLFDGYSAINLETPTFVKTHLGVINTLNLYVSGEVAIVPPSAELNLFVLGILDTTSGSFNSYIFGKGTTNNNHNLFIFGIQDIEFDNITLYMEVTSTGLFNQESTLYSHGF